MIRFSRYSLLYAIISCVVIGVGIFSIVRWGYRLSIDFAGGSEIQYMRTGVGKSPSRDAVARAVETQGASLESVETRGSTVIIRLQGLGEGKEPTLQSSLESVYDTSLTLLRANTVGPTVGKEAVRKTLIAVALGIVAILGYIFYAFRRMSFAVSAVVALVHDVLVVLGMYALIGHLFGAQLDTLFVTGLLTTMTFSTHDTIVIFDKIREYRRVEMHTPIEELADRAVSLTMVRSINNSLTILFMLVALVLLGGASIRFFAVTLLIGTVTGVYSSPFVATPFMILLEKVGKRG